MEKLFNITSIIGAGIGGILAYIFGGFDLLIKSLLVLVVLDYATGFIKGIYTKTLSSDIGFKGLLKKFLIFIVVSASVIIQRLINDAIPLREVVIMFFICNEGISLLENAAEIIPIPQKLKGILIQLRDNNNDKEQKGGGGLLTFDEFKNKYLGKKTNYDGVCGVQCVDLAKLYFNKCFGFKPGAWGNAKDYWTDFNNHPELVKNFEKIKNTPDFVPKKGDVVIWNENISSKNDYGHIAIATGEGDTSYFYSYDQNWECKEMKKIKHTYYAVYGVLRAKNNKSQIKTVKANGGLNAYTSLTASKSSLLIPNGTKVEVTNFSAGKKKIKGVTYTMAKIKYKGKAYFVAQKYLK